MWFLNRKVDEPLCLLVKPVSRLYIKLGHTMNLGILLTPWRLFSPTKSSRNSSNGEGNNLPRHSSNPLPVNTETETLTTNGFESYNALNEQLLRCIMTGKGDSKEADDIRDQMDVYWYKMSAAQQDAIRRHNETALGDRT